MSKETITITDETTGDELIEHGFGLIARGMFRIGEDEGNPGEAAGKGLSCASIIRDLAFDFARIRAAQRERE